MINKIITLGQQLMVVCATLLSGWMDLVNFNDTVTLLDTSVCFSWSATFWLILLVPLPFTEDSVNSRLGRVT